MRAKALLTCFLSALPVIAQNASPADTVLAHEKLFWSAYVTGNVESLGHLLTPDFTNVEQLIWDRTQVLEFVKKFHSMCTLAPVTPQDAAVSFTSPDTAIVVYHATESPTCGTHSSSGDTNITSLWLLRDGRWQLRLHTEYAVPPKP